MNQLSELQKSLVFRWEGSEWNPTRDEISGITGTAVDTYNVLNASGSGRRWLEYNGTSSYILSPTTLVFGTGDFTVITKIKVGSLGAVMALLGGEINSFDLSISATGYLIAKKIGETNLTASTTLLVASSIYSVGYSRSGTTGTYYINGIASGTCTDSYNYTSFSRYIGVSTPVDHYFNGSYFMLRIFNYALSAQQLINYSKPEYPIESVDRGAGVKYTSDFSSGVDGWNAGNTWNSQTVSGGKLVLSATAANQSNLKQPGIVSTKIYKWDYTASGLTGTIKFRLFHANWVAWASPIHTILTGTNTWIFTLPESSNGISVLSSANGDAVSLTAITLTQLGCVLDLNAEGMASATWVDKVNSLTATNSGTTYVCPPASNLKAMAFNGTTSKVILSGVPTLALGATDRTMSVWVCPQSFANMKLVCYGLSTAGKGSYIGLSASAKFNFGNSQFNAYPESSTTLVANNWYNLCITFSGGVVNYYLNGVYDGSGTIVNTDTWLGSFYAGSFFEYTDYMYNGLEGNSNVWSRILSPDEIKLIYDTGF